MASNDFSKKMKALSEGFDEALKNAGKGRGGLGVGSYQVRVTGHEMMTIKKGKSKGQLGSLFRFEVAAGKKQGKKHSKFQNLEGTDKDGDPVGLSVFLGDLETMEIKVAKKDMKRLDKKAEEAIGKIIEIEVVQNDRFRNTYINDLVQDAEEEEEIDDEELEDEDEEEEDEEEDEEFEDEEDEVELDEDEEEEEEEEEEEPPKRKRGRPKGSKNKPKDEPKKKKKKQRVAKEEDIDDIFG